MDLVRFRSSIVSGHSTYVEYVVHGGDTLGKITGEF